MSKKYGEDTCLYCEGEGTCSKCEGKGSLMLLGKRVECSSCQGTGKCPNCEGYGYIEDGDPRQGKSGHPKCPVCGKESNHPWASIHPYFAQHFCKKGHR